MAPADVGVLHLSYWSPDEPGSYNRSIDGFLRTRWADGHTLLTHGPARSLDSELASHVCFTSGREQAWLRTTVRRARARTPLARASSYHGRTFAAYATEAQRYVAEHDPAVVLVYDDVRLCLRLAAWRRPGHALVLSQHGTVYDLHPEVEAALYDRTRLDGVIVLSGAARDHIASRVGDRGPRVDVLPNAVDTERFRPASADERRAARERLGLGAGPVLAQIGRLVPAKGAFEGLEVAARVRASRPDVQLVLAGRGPAEDEARVRARAAASDLDGAVVLAGQLDRDGVAGLLRAADLVLFPTLLPEGMPLVVLEALAAGVPVVGYEFAAGAEIGDVTDGVQLVPRGDRDALAAAAGSWLDDAASRAEAARRARRRAVAGFAFDRWCERLDTILRGYVTD